MTASKRFTTAFPSHSLRGFSRGFCLPDAGRPSFRDTALPQVKRVDDLLQRLTLDERIALLHHDAPPVERLGVASFRPERRRCTAWPANSVLTSGPDGGIRSAASFAPRGRFISSIGHSITRPVVRWISALCRSSRNRKYVVSA